MTRSLLALLVALTGWIAVPPAAAQYPGYRPPYRPPVYPGYPGGGYNPYYPTASPGYNQLNGSADVMRAYGDVINQQEQARVTREQANQAKIDTKRKAFDEMQYEKANTPTYTETLTKEKGQILNRLMNYPIKSEVTSGKTLNTMLPYLQSLTGYGAQGPPVPLPSFAVGELNISGSASSSVGIFKDGGKVDWPIALRGPHQKKLDKLFASAYSAVLDNTLDPKTMREIRTEMKTMREELRQQLQKDEVETSSYLRAIEFYHSLEDSVNALERPDARKQLAGAYSPKATNVPELVNFMTANGLQFAPATPGNENAYQATHDAFVRYARTAQASAGMQSLHAPVGMAKNKK